MNKNPKKTTNAKNKPVAKKPAAKKPVAKTKKAAPKEKLKNPPPADLPLSDTWYHFADLMGMFKVSRTTLRRYITLGILFKHKWGTTIRFNKTYVDWMVNNGNRNFSWIIAFLTTAV